MSVYDWIKTRDRELADEAAGGDRYFLLSPTRLSLYRKLCPLLHRFVHGRCLDAGAGRMAYRQTIKETVEDYIAMDIRPRTGLHAAGSVLEMPWKRESFDSILCLQVLEHVPDPRKALCEFYCCLKPGGFLIFSAPHLAYLHNEPHDYFRFTKHGIRFLLERAGFSVEEIIPAGGLLSFLVHIPSMFIKALFSPIPVINRCVYGFNSIVSRVVVWLDERVETRKLFALNYIAVARKPLDSRQDSQLYSSSSF
ncbi:MAG: class I SAM-dependent methyltransferase [Candidatus Omnitrophota bacterium]|nr:MAG: class I SAM-dependent methyltransferase [Candidatus Omnitrophota bacterium]